MPGTGMSLEHGDLGSFGLLRGRRSQLVGELGSNTLVDRERRRTSALRGKTGHRQPQRLLVVRVDVDRLLGGLDSGGDVPGGQGDPGHEVTRPCRETRDCAPLVLEPHFVVGHRMREQLARRDRRRERRGRVTGGEPPLRLRKQLGGGREVEPVDIERVPAVAVGDPLGAEHTAQPAHDHRHLARRIARLFARPRARRRSARRSPAVRAAIASRRSAVRALRLPSSCSANPSTRRCR